MPWQRLWYTLGLVSQITRYNENAVLFQGGILLCLGIFLNKHYGMQLVALMSSTTVLTFVWRVDFPYAVVS